MRVEKISVSQLSLLLVTMIMSTGVLFFPASKAGHDAWLATILAGFVSLIMVGIIVYLYRKFPEQGLVQQGKILLGKYLGSAVGVVWCFYLMLLTAVTFRNMGDFSTVQLMPETPILVFEGLFMILAIWAAHEGLEVVARSNNFVSPIMYLSVVVVLILSLPMVEPGRLLPVAEYGIGPILLGSTRGFDWLGEVVILGVILPQVVKSSKIFISLGMGLTLVIVLLTGSAMSIITVLDFKMAQEIIFPLYNVAALINVADFIERFEPLIMLFWYLGMFIKLSFLLLVTCESIVQLGSLKDYRLLLWPVGILSVALSLRIAETPAQMTRLSFDLFPLLAVLVQIGYPLLLLIAYLIRWKIIYSKT